MYLESGWNDWVVMFYFPFMGFVPNIALYFSGFLLYDKFLRSRLEQVK